MCALIVWLTGVLLLKSIMCPYCLTYWRITTEINYVPLLFDLLTYYCWNQLCALIVWLTDVLLLKSIMCPYCLTCYKFLSYDFHIKTIFGSSLPPVVSRRAYVLLWVCFVCMFAHSVVQHILCCLFCLSSSCVFCLSWLPLRFSLTFIFINTLYANYCHVNLHLDWSHIWITTFSFTDIHVDNFLRM